MSCWTIDWLLESGRDAEGRLPRVPATQPGKVLAGKPQGDCRPPAATRKYRNVPTSGLDVAGATVRYDSRKEQRLAAELNSEVSAGTIVSWMRQVSFPIGPAENGRDVRYRADALAILEVNSDGTFVGRFLDAKGIDTPASRAKRAAARSLYGIDVAVL